MKAIIAVDPGKVSGLVTYWEDGNFNAGEYGFDETCDMLETFAAQWGPDGIIVCESFIINAQTTKNTQAPWSLELIGVSRRTSRRYTGRDLALQAPSQAKRFSSDQRLRYMGFWTPGKGHANDAARHLLLFLATRGHLPQDKLRALATIT